MVPSHPHVRSRVNGRSPLPHDDRSGGDVLPAEALHAESFALAVPPVAGAADPFFMRHLLFPSRRGDHPTRISWIESLVNGWRCPCFFANPLRRLYLKMTIFFA